MQIYIKSLFYLGKWLRFFRRRIKNVISFHVFLRRKKIKNFIASEFCHFYLYELYVYVKKAQLFVNQ